MINKSVVAVERILKAAFEEGMSVLQPSPTLEKLMLPQMSNSYEEKYGSLTEAPALSEWKDERNIKGADDRSYTLENLDWEATIGVNKNDIKYDKLNAVINRTRQLGIRAAEHWQSLLWTRIIEGDATTGGAGAAYDGVAFFSASHVEKDSGTQSNLESSGAGTTAANLESDFKDAMSDMIGLVDAEGVPIRSSSSNMDLVVCCPKALFGNFRDLQNAAIINNDTNTIRGAFSLEASARLTADDANDWYLFDAAMRKPFVKQISSPVNFLRLGEDSDDGFKRKLLYWGVDTSGNVGYLWWQSGYKVVNS